MLYYQGWTGARIAKALTITQKTMSLWKTQGNWANRKNQYLFNQEASERNIWELIMHQTEALRKMKDMMAEELANATSATEIRDKMMISHGEIDSLRKLVASISRKDFQAKDYMNLVDEFTSWMMAEDPKMAKVFVEYADQFLKSKITVLVE